MPTNQSEHAVDAEARSQIKGLQGEFHAFRTEIKQDVSGLRGEVMDGFQSVFKRLDADTRANMQASRGSFGQLAALATAVIGLAFSFTTLVTQPLRDQDDRHTQLMDRQLDRVFMLAESDAMTSTRLGKLETRAEANIQAIEKLYENVKRDEGLNTQTHNEFYQLKGKVDALHDQVKDLDTQVDSIRER